MSTPALPLNVSRSPYRTIFRYWLPMFGTWMIMAAEAPFVAAVIARMEDPKRNLAAFGVAYAVAILVESPVIMMLSASTALARGRDSFLRLRRFSTLLNTSLTVSMLLLVLTPAWLTVARRLIGLPDAVAVLSGAGLLWMTLWPAAIGYRRFYQGLLIQTGKTRRVAWGSLTRLVTMGAVSIVLFTAGPLPGALVGTAAIGSGVVVEAAVARFMARREVREILATPDPQTPPGYREIAGFYWPLALTSMIGLAVHPAVTFFMGRAAFALESLAVLPVVNSLTFVFRSIGLSYQEVAIALLGRADYRRTEVLRFAAMLAAGGTAAFALIALTPLASLWFVSVSGLAPDLSRLAIVATRILIPLPALSLLLSLQRAILVHGRFTAPITRATTVEVAGILLCLALLIARTDLVGATAAAIAILVGRLAGNALLVPPCQQALERDPTPADQPSHDS